MFRRSFARRLILLAILFAAVKFGPQIEGFFADLRGNPDTPSAPAGSSDDRAGVERIEQAFANRESDVWVEAAGVVDRTLADDNEGSRHQRFILRLASGSTILVSHNIDLAPRLENLTRGETVKFRGEYEWNERGGVVHWTHHDPQGRHEGGWLEREGRRVR